MRGNPRKGAPKIAENVAKISHKAMHPDTIRRVLRSHGYRGGFPRRKPLISE